MGVCWFFISALRIVQPNCGHQPPTSRVVWFICLESWFGALSEMVYFENPRMVILRMSTAFTVHWIVKKQSFCLILSMTPSSAGNQSTESKESFVSHFAASCSFKTK